MTLSLRRGSFATVGAALVITACAVEPLPGPSSPSPSRAAGEIVPSVRIQEVQVYRGEPNPDPDFCFASCPPEVVVKAGSDGALPVTAGATYTTNLLVHVVSPDRMLAVEVANDWSALRVESERSLHAVGGLIGWAVSFDAPPSGVEGVRFVTLTLRAGTASDSIRVALRTG